uniref:Uncharacterized protein n=1 Tax=Glossina pallidipes TaxID=7398 RepID=A0A1A9ZTG6_GLOPL
MNILLNRLLVRVQNQKRDICPFPVNPQILSHVRNELLKLDIVPSTVKLRPLLDAVIVFKHIRNVGRRCYDVSHQLLALIQSIPTGASNDDLLKGLPDIIPESHLAGLNKLLQQGIISRRESVSVPLNPLCM